MRQTLVKDGVQERLSNLIGDGQSAYSAQQSMIDDIKRVHFALLGDSNSGRIMGGMDLTLEGSYPTVSAGYGITIGGNLIKFGKSYKTNNSITASGTRTYQIYADYVVAERDDDHGGKQANFVNTTEQQNIIKDQVGAKGEDLQSGEELVVAVEESNPTVSETRLLIGTIQFANGSPTITSAKTGASDDVLYSYVKEAKNLRIFTGDISATAQQANIVALKNDSLMILEGGGRHRIKSLSVLRLNESTTASRVGATASDYNINLSIIGIANGGTEEVIASALELLDTTNDFDMLRFDIEDIIIEDFVALSISTSVTMSTATTDDYAAGYDGAHVMISCLLERLT